MSLSAAPSGNSIPLAVDGRQEHLTARYEKNANYSDRNANRSCAILAHPEIERSLTTTAMHRLLAVASDAGALTKIKGAMPLLSAIIVACGSTAECTLNLHTLGKELGAPHPTLKEWGRKLTALGYINCSPAGPVGQIIRLNTSLFRTVTEFTAMNRKVMEALTALEALREITINAIDGKLASLRETEAT